jgi:hypothetical protein
MTAPAPWDGRVTLTDEAADKLLAAIRRADPAPALSNADRWRMALAAVVLVVGAAVGLTSATFAGSLAGSGLVLVGGLTAAWVAWRGGWDW